MLKVIKVQLEGAKDAWLDELPSVLWAYRTIARTLAGEIPFNLTYDIEAVIPIEVRVTRKRRGFFDEEGNDDQLKMNLVYLDEVRTEASQRMTMYRQKMASYYNKRVKFRSSRLTLGLCFIEYLLKSLKPLKYQLNRTSLYSSVSLKARTALALAELIFLMVD